MNWANVARLLLVFPALSCGGSDGAGPGSSANEITQSCKQVDYRPGQPRTNGWVALTPAVTEPNPDNPMQQIYQNGHWVAVPLRPSSYPFTVREIQYELGTAGDPLCSAQAAHRVQLYVETSGVPAAMPTVQREFMTAPSADQLRTLVRHAVEPTLTLEEGDVLVVAIEQVQSANGFTCPVGCRTPDDAKQLGFRSMSAEPPFTWTDLSDYGAFRANPTLPWVSALDGAFDRTVPNVLFDAPSDGSQDSCIASIEPIGEGQIKCSVDHLCGDDIYRLSCLSPTSCACNAKGELGASVEKPEELCALTPREAEQIAIELCGW